MKVWKIIFLSKWMICRFHVHLPGCMSFPFMLNDESLQDQSTTNMTLENNLFIKVTGCLVAEISLQQFFFTIEVGAA